MKSGDGCSRVRATGVAVGNGMNGIVFCKYLDAAGWGANKTIIRDKPLKIAWWQRLLRAGESDTYVRTNTLCANNVSITSCSSCLNITVAQIVTKAFHTWSFTCTQCTSGTQFVTSVRSAMSTIIDGAVPCSKVRPNDPSESTRIICIRT